MNKLKDIFGALTVIALLGLANALATSATEYAAPTVTETEADIPVQQIKLCDADIQPSDGKLMFESTCRNGLKLFPKSDEQR
ncbi:hypothetical protein [Collimonas silvisoli]|uniref:hypothetical protein n=1 Tax=Collimonas silvisoli TaxID=2825884 RepID=UPI001B8BCB42|nr:hypothetical protein [Collimonas silvisoli]